MRSKRLCRQLKKTFGDEAVEDRVARFMDAVAGLPEGESRDELAAFLESFPDFLSAVDESYGQLEDKANIAQRSLEISSKELTEANSNLFHLNQTFDAMVNSLGQGFLLFGPDGICLPVHSMACETLLETNPSGRRISDVLKVNDSKREVFEDWCKMLFEELIDFEDLVEVGPKMFEHSEGRYVSLEFKPVRDREGNLQSVVLIATDRTNEIRAKQEAYKMHAFATMVTSILKDKHQFRNFVQVAREIIDEAARVVDQRGFGPEDFAAVKRGLHTLKGAAGSFGVLQVKDLVHEIETRIASEGNLAWGREYLPGAIKEVRTLFESLLSEHKELFDGVLADNGPVREIPLASLKSFAARLGDEGQTEFVEEFVAVALRSVFARYDGVLTDMAKRLGKKIEPIAFEGAEVRVIPEDYEDLFAAMIHMFRNIADHGIEAECKRLAAGKPGSGRVKVSASTSQASGRSHMTIIIEDDGAGIDTEKIRAKLRESGQARFASEASKEQLLNQIFVAGFSTANQLTDISGRGVGLDAVKYEVERLGGTISVSSELGRGTRFTISLPIAGESSPRLARAAS